MGNCLKKDKEPKKQTGGQQLGNGMDKVLHDRSDNQAAKIIVMGDQRVGKTSIIKAFLEGQTQKGAYEPTNTTQDRSKVTKVENDEGTETTLTMRIWDAAGDNEIHNLAHLFVKDVQCGILVYAINS